MCRRALDSDLAKISKDLVLSLQPTTVLKAEFRKALKVESDTITILTEELGHLVKAIGGLQA